MKFPYEFTQINEEINSQLLKSFTGEKTGFYQLGPKKWFVPSPFKNHAEVYYNFEIKPNDLWLVSFPRTGTTLTQELVWLLANNLDFQKASNFSLGQRFPYFDFDGFMHPDVIRDLLKRNEGNDEICAGIRLMEVPRWKSVLEMEDRRFIKTHLPFDLLPPNLCTSPCKIIYIARNAKDVAVSYYHLSQMTASQSFQDDFQKFWTYFKDGFVSYCPFWTHIQEGWERRNLKNFLFLFYEDLNKDMVGSLKKIAEFLEVEYTEEQYLKLADHLKIENFKKNKAINLEGSKRSGFFRNDVSGDFIRKGGTGGWRNYFTTEMNQEADEWIAENLEKTGIKFPDF